MTKRLAHALAEKFVEIHNAMSDEYKQAFIKVGARMWHDDSAHKYKRVHIESIAQAFARDIDLHVYRPLTVLDAYKQVTREQRASLNAEVDKLHRRHIRAWKRAKREILA